MKIDENICSCSIYCEDAEFTISEAMNLIDKFVNESIDEPEMIEGLKKAIDDAIFYLKEAKEELK